MFCNCGARVIRTHDSFRERQLYFFVFFIFEPPKPKLGETKRLIYFICLDQFAVTALQQLHIFMYQYNYGLFLHGPYHSPRCKSLFDNCKGRSLRMSTSQSQGEYLQHAQKLDNNVTDNDEVLQEVLHTTCKCPPITPRDGVDTL